MYRIAIIDRDFAVREETHRLAAAFFAQRGESAAFVICAAADKLPADYDCYLRGDERQIRLFADATEQTPLGSMLKPPQAEDFARMMHLWHLRSETTRG